jgi:hypothetical protein
MFSRDHSIFCVCTLACVLLFLLVFLLFYCFISFWWCFTPFSSFVQVALGFLHGQLVFGSHSKEVDQQSLFVKSFNWNFPSSRGQLPTITNYSNHPYDFFYWSRGSVQVWYIEGVWLCLENISKLVRTNFMFSSLM